MHVRSSATRAHVTFPQHLTSLLLLLAAVEYNICDNVSAAGALRLFHAPQMRNVKFWERLASHFII